MHDVRAGKSPPKTLKSVRYSTALKRRGFLPISVCILESVNVSAQINQLGCSRCSPRTSFHLPFSSSFHFVCITLRVICYFSYIRHEINYLLMFWTSKFRRFNLQTLLSHFGLVPDKTLILRVRQHYFFFQTMRTRKNDVLPLGVCLLRNAQEG